MKALFEQMMRDGSVRKIVEAFSRQGGKSLVYGLSGSQKHALFAVACAAAEKSVVIVTHSREAIDAWRTDLASLLPEREVLELPEVDMMTVEATAKGMERMALRMGILGRLLRKEPVLVLAHAAAAVQKGVSRQDFERMSLRLEVGATLSRETLLSRLVELGYEAEGEVEGLGQFSARGGIVDLHPLNAPLPLRVEFFDDEIDSLREFDPVTRRSVRNVPSAVVLPVASIEDGSATVLSYLAGEGAVIFDEPLRTRESVQKLVKETPELKSRLFSWEELVADAEGNATFFAALMLQKIHGAEPDSLVSLAVQAVAPFQRQMDLLKNETRSWLANKQNVLLLVGDAEKAASLRELFAKSRIPSAVVKDGEPLNDAYLNIQVGTLANGFELPEARLVVVAEKDIFGRQKKKLAQKAPKEERIAHFREINVGDYVVHVNHGVGKYLGVETLDVGGIKKDYLHIKYGGDDKLFVPTDQVGLLQKYIGSEGDVPRLHRMGGTEWVKAKARARASVEDIADELIALYAKRRTAQGFAFSPDTPWQREFEDAFPYEETPDQRRAIEEIKADMEKPEPMDRLLCGDVGFGKTEVAIRAAYKAVMDKKQVAVLVPTTVLAQQHYQTFSARFADFGVNIDVICRFRSAKEQKATIERLKESRVDVLIGTHAILNQKRVQFFDLGLLIVDEEQRFGVKQKEKIKKLAAGVDVLTLSATPIPRTLHMSLVGARDMSIIETPPAERFPVQSYVVEDSEVVLKNAIRRELRRGGQVYFVYNRVESIDLMRQRLEDLVPEARIQTGHGQMAEELLERVMVDFYEGRYDILLATSIVENGLDVANANTIIVYNADQFGLSQLYQMRGRVGRSNHMAFAYFVYQADKVLSEMAEKRLQAMKEFAELGAGFKIAMRDLEIRGAGNLLGAEQHGHIASVGFEMYSKLLDEAIQERRTGKPVEEKVEPVVDIEAEAYLDGAYIGDPMHKIEIYQRIAAIRKNAQIQDLLDELIDRFGEPTPVVMRLLEVARIRNYARDLGIRSIMEKPLFLEISFVEKPSFDPDGLLKLLGLFGRNVKMLPPPQQMLRIRLAAQYKKNITNFITRVMMLLAGEQGALARRDGAAKKTQKKGERRRA